MSYLIPNQLLLISVGDCLYSSFWSMFSSASYSLAWSPLDWTCCWSSFAWCDCCYCWISFSRRIRSILLRKSTAFAEGRICSCICLYYCCCVSLWSVSSCSAFYYGMPAICGRSYIVCCFCSMLSTSSVRAWAPVAILLSWSFDCWSNWPKSIWFWVICCML